MERKAGRPRTKNPLAEVRAVRMSEEDSERFDRQAHAQGMSPAIALRKLMKGFISGVYAVQLTLL
jgi:hypothetical protein